LRKTAITFILLALGGRALAQEPFPEPGPVFRDDLLPIVKIWLPVDSLNKLYADPQLDHEYPVTFSFESGTVRDTLYQVGFRFRGNTSRDSAKKSFKLSFNTFVKKRDYYGLEKMNLNGEHNDPSVIRSKLYWDLCRDFGIPAPRSNHVLLYINDVFKGVYINVEQIDEEFTGLRFGSKTGNLYKCLWPADLTYRGINPDAYKFTSGNRRAYELKTNEEADDYAGLAGFIDILNNTPYGLQEKLENAINIPVLLRMIVLDVFTANWDGPFYNKNNFYLYDNPLTGRFEIMPYDVDNTFGIDWFSVDWALRNVYSWSHPSEPRPLYTKVLGIPAFRREFTRLFYELLDLAGTNDRLEEHALALRSLYAPYIPEDPLYPFNYGWDTEEFYESFTNRLDASFVTYGLFPYINTRIAYARQQLDELSGTPDLISDQGIRIYPNPASDYVFLEGISGYESWSLTSGFGQRIASGPININGPETLKIPLAGIPSGLYIFSLVPETATRSRQPATLKLVIAR